MLVASVLSTLIGILIRIPYRPTIEDGICETPVKMSSHTAKRALRQVLATTSRTSVVQPSRKSLPSCALRCRTRSSNSTVSYHVRQSLNTGSTTRHHSTIAQQQSAPSPIPEISDRDTYDIVIIGAGNAGLALACTLRTHLS
jgi:hypothetical protein